MYLIDTNVLSALAPGRAQVSPGVAAWLKQESERLFLSAVTIAEIEAGVAKLRRLDANGRATALESWLNRLLATNADQILPLDVEAARLAGRLIDRARASGVNPGFADIAIAATAHVRGYTVLTANGRHFTPLGVAVLNPFEMFE
jgi:toxin FitB